MDCTRWWVYVLRSIAEPQQRYVGMTSDLERRWSEHNASHTHHTARYAPWRIIVTIGFDDSQRAAGFEKYLKSGSGRAFITRHFE